LFGFNDNGNGTYFPSIGFGLSQGHQGDVDAVSILQSRFALDNEASNRFQIAGSGKLGWGPGTSPIDTSLSRNGPGSLHLASTGQTTLFLDANPANQASLAFNGTSQGSIAWQLMRINTNSVVFWNQSVGQFFYLNPNGTVGIGTSEAQYPLAVKGTIAAQEMLVTSTSSWPDYVFGREYRLAPLSEVAEYVGANGHLPGIPSADEVKEKGVSLGDMQAKLLAKIEELTLHMIAAEKENRELRERIGRLETK